MKYWMAFSVFCAGCGHKNRPSLSPREGIRMVLDGTFAACTACGKEFRLIRIPLRPLVREELTSFSRDEVSRMSERLRFFKYENRKTPAATGYLR